MPHKPTVILASMPGTEPVVPHHVKFESNLVTRLWRCRCSCGWGDAGTEDQVKISAAGHDLWIDEPPGQFEIGAIMRDSR
jgi:hypothetical protein